LTAEISPMQPGVRPPVRAWVAVGLLWVALCSYSITQNMIATMHGSLVAAIPMTEAQFGLMISVLPWIFGVVSPFAGFLSDRFSRRWMIIGSMFLWSATTWLTAYAKTYPELLAMRALLAVSQGCYWPAGGALVVDYHRGPTRSFAASLYMTGFYVGGVLSSVGGWLAERHSWTYAFSAVGLPSLVYSLLLIMVLFDAPRENGARGEAQPPVRLRMALASLFSRRSFIIVLACVTLADAVGMTMEGWLPTYMKEHFRIGQSAAGFSATGYRHAADIIGLLLGGAWSTRWGRTNARSCILVPAIGLFFASAAMLLAVNTHSLAISIAALLAVGLTASCFTANVLPMLCLTIDSRYYATGLGLILTAVCLVGGVFVYVAGVLRDGNIGLDKIFDLGALGWMLCVGMLLLLKLAPAPPASGGPTAVV